MKKLLNIFPRESIRFIFYLGLLILLSTSAVAYLNMKDMMKTERDITGIYTNMDYLEKMISTIALAEAGRRAYFITGDEESLTEYKSASGTIDTLYSKLRKDTDDNPNQQYNLDTLRMLITQRFDVMKRSINIQQTKGTSLKNFQSLAPESSETQQKIKALVTRMKAEEEYVVNQKQLLTDKSSKFTLYIMAGGALISFLIMLSMFSMAMAMGTSSYKDPRSHKMTQGELESVVRDRTAEISKMNKKLNQKVSELEISDAALKRSEQDYRALFEQAHDAIIIFNPEDEKILDVNVRACEIYGLNKEVFNGMSLKNLSKNNSETEEQIKLTLQKGYYHNFQSVHYKKDGTEMLMEINASVIYYKGIPAILSINRDITDRIMRIK